MNQALDILRQTRQNILGTISGLSTEQLNKIPTGFRNNIAWNLGHVVVTQQLLCYRLSGLDCLVEESWIAAYRKGSKPEGPISAEEINQIKDAFFQLLDATEKDIAKGIFQNYKEYPTSYGVVLKSFEDAIWFNNVHEAMHLGNIMSMKKLI